MLPSDFSPEKQARQRYVQRQQDLREAKVKVSAPLAFWSIEVQFDKSDFDAPTRERISAVPGDPGLDTVADTFRFLAQKARLDFEERFRERRAFVKIPARTSKEAIKIANDLLAQAVKSQRDNRLQARGRR